jgi:hypothetical protein
MGSRSSSRVALRLCYFEDYRYSADLDSSSIGGLDRSTVLQAVAGALPTSQQALGLPALSRTDATLPPIQYTGPLGRSRTVELDLALDELLENTTRRTVSRRYSDQPEHDCLVYSLQETVALEAALCHPAPAVPRPLRHQRVVCRARFGPLASFGPCSNARRSSAGSTQAFFAARFQERLPQYEARRRNELFDHVAGEPPPLETLLRAVRRALRDLLY